MPLSAPGLLLVVMFLLMTWNLLMKRAREKQVLSGRNDASSSSHVYLKREG